MEVVDLATVLTVVWFAGVERVELVVGNIADR